MIWIFKRGDQSLRLETRYDNETTEYVLIVHHPDGSHQTERFNDSVAFQTRLDTLDRQLGSENWHYVGAPVLLGDGWKI
jgi:hypothetical protein